MTRQMFRQTCATRQIRDIEYANWALCPVIRNHMLFQGFDFGCLSDIQHRIKLRCEGAVHLPSRSDGHHLRVLSTLGGYRIAACRPGTLDKYRCTVADPQEYVS